ncbi:hypothetical protein [Azoarcus sp. CIB]|nr:hypothetical protein [Azoarcus sp. CIB]
MNGQLQTLISRRHQPMRELRGNARDHVITITRIASHPIYVITR